MGAQRWPEAFLGVSALLGEPIEASLVALDGALSAPVAPGLQREPLPSVESRRGAHLEGWSRQAPELLRALRSPSRDVRAQAIARAVTAVVVALNEMRLG
jgi:hypothetical protein